ncbi:MAG: tetratricopeptide repeat protein [Candidatus Omnitrophica bacterium]|nr:tetratricopeptide repeat protein [Candidatus Omnitrophota bacterium]
MKGKTIIFLSVVTIVLAVSFTPVFAEIVILKSGKRIECKVVKSIGNVIDVDTGTAVFPIPINEIDHIIKDEASSKGTTYIDLMDKATNDLLDGRYDDTYETLKKAKRLFPDNPDIDVALSVSLFYLNRTNEAIPYLRTALASNKIGNISDEFLISLAFLCDSVGSKKEAEAEMVKYINKCKNRKDLIGMFKGDILLRKISGR